MQSLSRALFILLTAMMLMLGACSKSVEGENKKWEANSAKITELAAQYPGFKAPLEARKKSAEEIFEAAQGLSGDDQIEKLSAANTALMKGFVSDLNSLDRKIKKLREARVEAASKAGESTKMGAKVALEDAQKTLDRVESTLKQGASDEAGANAVLKKIKDDIKTAQSAIEKVLSVDKAKKDDAKAAKKAAADKKASDKKAADAKVAPWKCEYCDTSNDHKDHKCKSCGAARPADKKKK